MRELVTDIKAVHRPEAEQVDFLAAKFPGTRGRFTIGGLFYGGCPELEEPMVAHAHAMAAGPALLAASKTVASDADMLSEDSDGTPWYRVDAIHIIALRAEIARAQGGAA